MSNRDLIAAWRNAFKDHPDLNATDLNTERAA